MGASGRPVLTNLQILADVQLDARAAFCGQSTGGLASPRNSRWAPADHARLGYAVLKGGRAHDKCSVQNGQADLTAAEYMRRKRLRAHGIGS